MSFQALIKIPQRKGLQVFDLPISIGKTEQSQVLINDEELAGKDYYVVSNESYAFLLDSDGRKRPLNILNKYGIRILGVVEKGKNNFLWRILAMERQALSGLSDSLKDFLFFKKSSLPRYSVYIICCLFILFQILFPSKEKPSVSVNLSHQVIELRQNVQDPNIYGNYKKFNTNPEALKYKISLLEGVNGRPLPAVFSFKVLGLDHQGEVELKINDKSLYISKIEKECFFNSCLKSLKVDNKILNVGDNSIEFIHHNKDSIYLVGKTLFKSLKKMDGAMSNRVDLYFDEAKTLFEKRSLGVINLLKAKKLLGKIVKIENDFFIPIEKSDMINSLSHRINETIKTFVDDFWFTVDKKISLGKYDSALVDLNEMANYFPDASSREGRKVINKIKAINQILGR